VTCLFLARLALPVMATLSLFPSPRLALATLCVCGQAEPTNFRR
jgi:hypothetical protein